MVNLVQWGYVKISKHNGIPSEPSTNSFSPVDKQKICVR